MTYADVVHAGPAAPPREARLDDPARFPPDPGWFVDLGMVLLILGAIASVDLLFARTVPIRDMGLLMIVAGVAQVAHALRVGTSGGVVPWVAGGALHGLAGALAFWLPLASPALGPLVSLALALAGASRLLAWRDVRSEADSDWTLGAGLVTALASFLALAAWRLDAPGAAALVLVVDLNVQGFAWLALGLELDGVQGEGHSAGAEGRTDA